MKKNDMPILKDEGVCTGCGACIASCSQNAIEKKHVGFGAWIPEINKEVCINCGRCEAVCKVHLRKSAYARRAYIAYNKDPLIRQKSASGGAFSALATYVLDHNGCVFGAEMHFENGKAVVEHRMITQVKKLSSVLGSKYVQSDCVKAYQQCKKELLSGKTVLFSGCSCQIAGLKKYLENTDQTNLYTIDLICHGVPGVDFLNDYMQFLEEKYNGKIQQLSFRIKEKKKTVYCMTAGFDEKCVGGGRLPNKIQNRRSD